MIVTNPFLNSGNRRWKIKSQLRTRAGLDSAQESDLLSEQHLSQSDRAVEQQFWIVKILPLVEVNTWRSADANGLNLSWRIDTPFRLLFQSTSLRTRGRAALPSDSMA